MTIAITTRQLRDAAGTLFLMQCIDRSGTGAGPFIPLHIIGSADGANAVDFEALFADQVTAAAATTTAVQTNTSQLHSDFSTIHNDLGLLATAAQIGAAQASPAQYTVLDRLKAIATGLGSVVLAAGTAVIGKVGLQVAGADVAASNPIPVSSAPGTQAYGQIVIASTGTAVQLPSRALINGLVIKARSTNAANGFVGGSGVTTTDDGTGNGYRIAAGEGWSGTPSNANAVYVNGSAGDVFYFTGS